MKIYICFCPDENVPSSYLFIFVRPIFPGILPYMNSFFKVFISSRRRAMIGRADFNSCTIVRSFTFKHAQLTQFTSSLPLQNSHWLIASLSSLSSSLFYCIKWSSIKSSLYIKNAPRAISLYSIALSIHVTTLWSVFAVDLLLVSMSVLLKRMSRQYTVPNMPIQ
jgi:hypothetical protein